MPGRRVAAGGYDQVVSKFTMWLVRVRDIDINDLYDTQSFMQHLTHTASLLLVKEVSVG